MNMKKEESIVELLMLVPGINVNRYNALWGLTPLMLAAWISNANMVKLLLGVTGIQVNARDIVGYDLNPREVQDQTVLHQAVIRYFEGHPKTRADYEIVEMLLQAEDVDVNAQDRKGNTALHYAVFGKKKQIVELLVNVVGIKVRLENNDDITSWGWALVNSRSTCFPLVDAVHKAEKRSKASSKAEKGSSSKSGWFRRRRG
ncbi:unnamed protein product (mitochondrion) [Plasmodiophora brassicae]|uniref:Uncharacterized protein n=1 Tax=Plasmodiophora brassicae TaxID=37360 RepID=A0A3P3YHH1_PLABS|nr:unnamed protein product [Plasmodiophora brassicae]